MTLGTGGGGIGVTDPAATLTLSGTLTGAILRKEGAGTLVLSGTNNYTGLTTVNAGTLQAGSTQAFGSTTGGMTVKAGATPRSEETTSELQSQMSISYAVCSSNNKKKQV